MFLSVLTGTITNINIKLEYQPIFFSFDRPMVCAEESVQDSERHFATPWTGGSLCGLET